MASTSGSTCSHPGERVPCAAFPDDDLVVIALRADFAGSEAVTVRLTAADDTLVNEVRDVPVGATDVELLWATPGESIRQMSSARLRLTVRSQSSQPAVLAEYELDHESGVGMNFSFCHVVESQGRQKLKFIPTPFTRSVLPRVHLAHRLVAWKKSGRPGQVVAVDRESPDALDTRRAELGLPARFA